MVWLWIAGAALAAMCSVACGLNLGSRVAKGAEFAWQPSILGWAVGMHGGFGVLALYLLMQVR